MRSSASRLGDPQSTWRFEGYCSRKTVSKLKAHKICFGSLGEPSGWQEGKNFLVGPSYAISISVLFIQFRFPHQSLSGRRERGVKGILHEQRVGLRGT